LSPVRGHGIEWKRKCLEVGARPERCWSSKRVVAPPARFIGTCPRCERQIRRHRRKHISCGRCDKKFNKDLLLQWRELDHEEMQPQTPFVAVDL
jgi:predicted amidophosphoribosyltransferase